MVNKPITTYSNLNVLHFDNVQYVALIAVICVGYDKMTVKSDILHYYLVLISLLIL